MSAEIIEGAESVYVNTGGAQQNYHDTMTKTIVRYMQAAGSPALPNLYNLSD